MQGYTLSRWVGLVLPIVVLILCGCASVDRLQACPAGEERAAGCVTAGTRATPLNGFPSLAAWKQDWLASFAPEPWARGCDAAARARGTCTRPAYGLALAGGGSKAAPFAMGAIKRLVDDEMFSSVDVLTSVSGGGYAAYYLYHKAHEQLKASPTVRERPVRLSDWFVDSRLECRGLVNGADCIPPIFATPDLARQFARSDLDCSTFPQVASSSQKWVACYQDLFAGSYGGNYWNWVGFPFGSYFAGIIGTLASLPFHHAANTLFDLGLPLSPSQAMYFEGILRAYGVSVLNADGPLNASPDGSRLAPRRLSYDDLKELYEREPNPALPKMPYWVIQATNAISTSSWFDIQDKPYELDEAVFEIGAYGFGSGAYGHVRRSSPDILDRQFDVARSVLASAAFLDPAQRMIKMNRGLVFLALHSLNLKWGIRLPNYNVDKSNRLIHAALPFPFYYAHAFRADADNPYIRLSDGGQSGDNLGVYAQLQRGVRNIIAIDGAHDLDDHGRSFLPELCAIDSYLRNRHQVRLVFRGTPEHPNDDATAYEIERHCVDAKRQADIGLKDCTDGSATFCRPSPYKWRRKVWVGTVQRIRGVPEEALSPLGRVLSDENEPTRIFYAKSAMDYDSIMQVARDYYRTGRKCTSVANEDGALPCGLLYYMGGTEWTMSQDRYKGRQLFPQTSTVEQTADSNRQAYYAYLDLGWYVAGGLCEQPELRHTGLCGKSAAHPGGGLELVSDSPGEAGRSQGPSRQTAASDGLKR